MADGLTLSEQDRAKLDGIVSQMETNKESAEDIQFVVNDFKQKYGIAGVPATDADPLKKKGETEPSPSDTGNGISDLEGGALGPATTKGPVVTPIPASPYAPASRVLPPDPVQLPARKVIQPSLDPVNDAKLIAAYKARFKVDPTQLQDVTKQDMINDLNGVKTKGIRLATDEEVEKSPMTYGKDQIANGAPAMYESQVDMGDGWKVPGMVFTMKDNEIGNMVGFYDEHNTDDQGNAKPTIDLYKQYLSKSDPGELKYQESKLTEIDNQLATEAPGTSGYDKLVTRKQQAQAEFDAKAIRFQKSILEAKQLDTENSLRYYFPDQFQQFKNTVAATENNAKRMNEIESDLEKYPKKDGQIIRPENDQDYQKLNDLLTEYQNLSHAVQGSAASIEQMAQHLELGPLIQDFVDLDQKNQAVQTEAMHMMEQYPELAAKISKQKGQQELTDTLYKYGVPLPGYDWLSVNVTNQVGRAVTNFAQGATFVPKLLGYRDEYGFTDKWYDASANFFDEFNTSRLPSPSEFEGALFKGGNIQKNLIIPKLTYGVTNVGLMAATALATAGAGSAVGISTEIAGNVGTVMSGIITTAESSYREAVNAGMSESDAINFASAFSVQQGILELVNPEVALIRQGLTRQATKTFVERLATGITKKEAWKEATKAVIKNMGAETLQETMQQIDDIGNKLTANGITGSEFQGLDPKSIKDQMYEVMFVTPLISLPFGAAGGMKGASRLQTESLYGAALNTEEAKSHVAAMLADGRIDKTKAQSITDGIDKASIALTKMPKNLDDAQRIGILPELMDKIDLEAHRKIADASFHETLDAQIQQKADEIKDKIGVSQQELDNELAELSKVDKPFEGNYHPTNPINYLPEGIPEKLDHILEMKEGLTTQDAKDVDTWIWSTYREMQKNQALPDEERRHSLEALKAAHDALWEYNDKFLIDNGGKTQEGGTTGGQQTTQGPAEGGTDAVVPAAQTQALTEDEQTDLEHLQSMRDGQIEMLPEEEARLKELESRQGPAETYIIPATETTPEGNVVISFAPYRATNVGTVKEAADIRNEPAYKEYVASMEGIAKAIGITGNRKETIGGYFDNNGNKIQEVSNRMEFPAADKEKAELFAALAGTLSPELQESVLTTDYKKEGEGSEYEFTFASAEQAEAAIISLKDNNIFNFAFDDKANTLYIADPNDTDGENIEKFVIQNKDGIKEHTIRYADIAFPDKGRYQEILDSPRWSSEGGSSGANTRKLIAQAKRILKSSEPGTPATGTDGGRVGNEPSPTTSESRDKLRGGARVPNADIQQDAAGYVAEHKKDLKLKKYKQHDPIPVDTQKARERAARYAALPADDSKNPAVKRAYEALAKEVQMQWDYLISKGYKIDWWTSDGTADQTKAKADESGNLTQPYANSAEMMNDLMTNKHLSVFVAGEPHPFFTDDAEGVNMNIKLRAVHDILGHAAAANEFGATGEENAWLEHSKLFSPLAQAALTTETRGQNSWVNYNEDMWDAEGNYKGVKSHPEYIAPESRPYADQKVAILPDEDLSLEGKAVPGLRPVNFVNVHTKAVGDKSNSVTKKFDVIHKGVTLGSIEKNTQTGEWIIPGRKEKYKDKTAASKAATDIFNNGESVQPEVDIEPTKPPSNEKAKTEDQAKVLTPESASKDIETRIEAMKKLGDNAVEKQYTRVKDLIDEHKKNGIFDEDTADVYRKAADDVAGNRVSAIRKKADVMKSKVDDIAEALKASVEQLATLGIKTDSKDVVKSGYDANHLIDLVARIIKKAIDGGATIAEAMEKAKAFIKTSPLYKKLVANGTINEEEFSKGLDEKFGNITDEPTQKPPANPPAGTTTESGETLPKKKTAERIATSNLIDRDIKDGLEEHGYDYVPDSRKITEEDAKEYVRLFQEAGEIETAVKHVMNRNNGMKDFVRGMVAAELFEAYSAMKKAAVEESDKKKFTDTMVDLTLLSAEMFNQAGKSLALAAKRWKRLSEEGTDMILSAIEKEFRKRRNELLEPYKKNISDIFDPLNKALDKVAPDKDVKIENMEDIKNAMGEDAFNKLKEKWDEAMKGLKLDHKEADELFQKVFQHHWDGTFNKDKFKELLGGAMGFPVLTDELKKHIDTLSESIKNAETAARDFKNALDALAAAEKNPDSVTADQLKKLQDDVAATRKAYINTSHQANVAQGLINKYFVEKKGVWDVLISNMQGNLLTVKSLIVNAYANTLIAPARMAIKGTASAMDYMLSMAAKHTFMSKFLSTDRTVDFIANQRGALKGLPIGFVEAGKEFKTGAPQINKDVEVFNSFRAIKDMGLYLNGKQKGTIENKVATFFEATGITADIMFRMLNLGDKPIRKAAEFGKAFEIGWLKGLRGAELEKFVFFPGEDIADAIKDAGATATYQQENAIQNNIVTPFMKYLSEIPIVGGPLKLLAKSQMPYVSTPLNLLKETALLAVPEVALAMGLYNAAKGRRAESIDMFARGMVGMIIGATIQSLVIKGLLTAGADDNKEDKQKERDIQQQVIPPYSFNITGFARMMAFGDPKVKDTDTWIDARKMGVLGTLMAIHANKFKGMTPEEMQGITHISKLLTTIPYLLRTGLDQSFLAGTNTLLNAIHDGGKAADRWVVNTLRALGATVLPNTVASVSRASEEHIKELKNLELTDRIIDNFKLSLFAGKDLPTKINIWGDPVDIAPAGRGKYPYYLFDITSYRKIDHNNFGFYIYKFWKEMGEDEKVLPTPPSNRITFGNKSKVLDPYEYEDLQREVGGARKNMIQSYVMSHNWLTDSKEIKLSNLRNMYEAGSEIGKAKFLSNNSDVYKYFIQ